MSFGQKPFAHFQLIVHHHTIMIVILCNSEQSNDTC
jgi:hypothetical protein